MKKINYLLLGLVAVFSLTAGVMYHAGTPGQKSGSPGDGGATCIQCHGGSPVEVAAGWITSDIPANGYTAETTYNITLVGHYAGSIRYGFEMTAEDNTNAKKGTFAVTNPTETQLVFGQSSAITHTGSGITPTNDSISWSFTWTAPVAGTGDVTFYAAVNAANGNFSTSGDRIFTSTLTVSEEIITSIENTVVDNISIYPNPAVSVINLKGIDATVNNIVLLNAAGQEVRNINTNGSDLAIDVNDLDKGMYFLNIISSEKVRTEKVFVQ